MTLATPGPRGPGVVVSGEQVMTDAPQTPLLLIFDGECGLCQAAVRFVLARDRHARFRFAAAGSAAGHAGLDRLGLAAVAADSMVLVEHGRALVKSDAALAVARHLAWPWPLAALLRFVPRRLRDAVYDWVAARRRRWGDATSCPVPPAEWRERFLE
jgi:predicted DCC family thiol-disulfide oxidoreductase YuxK